MCVEFENVMKKKTVSKNLNTKSLVVGPEGGKKHYVSCLPVMKLNLLKIFNTFTLFNF